MSTLLIEFSTGSNVSVRTDGGRVVVDVDGETHALSRADAAALRDAVGDALTGRESFFRTACEYREDGSYVVERRNADSSGNSTVFDSFGEVRLLFERLPDEFGADDVSRAGVTGSRRHMVVRHFVEHPAFACTLTSRSPLRARKANADADGEGDGGGADG